MFTSTPLLLLLINLLLTFSQSSSSTQSTPISQTLKTHLTTPTNHIITLTPSTLYSTLSQTFLNQTQTQTHDQDSIGSDSGSGVILIFVTPTCVHCKSLLRGIDGIGDEIVKVLESEVEGGFGNQYTSTSTSSNTTTNSEDDKSSSKLEVMKIYIVDVSEGNSEDLIRRFNIVGFPSLFYVDFNAYADGGDDDLKFKSYPILGKGSRDKVGLARRIVELYRDDVFVIHTSDDGVSSVSVDDDSTLGAVKIDTNCNVLKNDGLGFLTCPEYQPELDTEDKSNSNTTKEHSTTSNTHSDLDPFHKFGFIALCNARNPLHTNATHDAIEIGNNFMNVIRPFVNGRIECVCSDSRYSTTTSNHDDDDDDADDEDGVAEFNNITSTRRIQLKYLIINDWNACSINGFESYGEIRIMNPTSSSSNALDTKRSFTDNSLTIPPPHINTKSITNKQWINYYMNVIYTLTKPLIKIYTPSAASEIFGGAVSSSIRDDDDGESESEVNGGLHLLIFIESVSQSTKIQDSSGNSSLEVVTDYLNELREIGKSSIFEVVGVTSEDYSVWRYFDVLDDVLDDDDDEDTDSDDDKTDNDKEKAKPKLPKLLILDSRYKGTGLRKYYYTHPSTQSLTPSSLLEFLNNFTEGKLKISFKSEDDAGLYTSPPSSNSRVSNSVIKVTANTFPDIILNARLHSSFKYTGTIVLFHALYCGFSNRVLTVLNELAIDFESEFVNSVNSVILNDTNNIIERTLFTKIDATKNEVILPTGVQIRVNIDSNGEDVNVYEHGLNVDRFPTIYYFPAVDYNGYKNENDVRKDTVECVKWEGGRVDKKGMERWILAVRAEEREGRSRDQKRQGL